MRIPPKYASLCALLLAAGCRRAEYVAPPSPMPPSTILLSQMMSELLEQRGLDDAIIQQIDKGSKNGPALLTPALADELRDDIRGQNWSGLDRFPGWTIHEINPATHIAGHVAGKSQTREKFSAVHLGASPSAAQTHEFLDLGPYALDKPYTASLDVPSTLPGFATEGNVDDLGADVVRGDAPNDLAPEHAESQRLANALNRLAANTLDGAAPITFSLGGHTAHTPQELIAAVQASGHEVTVTDSRYFANFGHFHYDGQDVMAPFWVDSQIPIPQSGGRHLLVPVTHAEYEWHIRSPQGRAGLNADVSYYLGNDGKSEWRTMDTLDQAWVLGRNAHTYRDAQAVEVTRLAGLLTVTYMHLHAAHPMLPFNGYYALGGCQDGISAIEQHMTGRNTLFPNTADDDFFKDPRDSEINALIASIPKDRDGAAPDPARIFGSLPADPGADNDFSAIAIPGLATDLSTVHKAWTNGTLRRPEPRRPPFTLVMLALVALGIGFNKLNMRRHNLEFLRREAEGFGAAMH
jgi:hypothetical protein